MADSDPNNFTPPHRLPTVSASQALQGLTSNSRAISTNISQLDSLLQSKSSTDDFSKIQKGLPRGQITEINGPPGVGKTAFALIDETVISMQVCAAALHGGDHVVWIDTGHPLVGKRLEMVVSSFEPSGSEQSSSLPAAVTTEDLLANLKHTTTPTLAHLLAVILHLPPGFLSSKTSLVVIDSVSTLLSTAFPRALEESSRYAKGSKQTPRGKNDLIQGAISRKWAVIGELISHLSKFAATRNIAILLTSQMATKIEFGAGAFLCPAITGRAWDSGVNNRLVLFRDALSNVSMAKREEVQLRFAGLLKVGGISRQHNDSKTRVVPFTISDTGLREVGLDEHPDQAALSMPLLVSPRNKRKREEIPDSQSEDEAAESDDEYGWIAEDSLAVEDRLLEDDSRIQENAVEDPEFLEKEASGNDTSADLQNEGDVQRTSSSQQSNTREELGRRAVT